MSYSGCALIPSINQASFLDDCIARLNENLESVASLNDDQLLRRFMELIQATLRTNYYQKADDGRFKDYISYKLEPSKVTGMPKPRPAFEIFVVYRA